jgi:hypothetical protein
MSLGAGLRSTLQQSDPVYPIAVETGHFHVMTFSLAVAQVVDVLQAALPIHSAEAEQIERADRVAHTAGNTVGLRRIQDAEVGFPDRMVVDLVGVCVQRTLDSVDAASMLLELRATVPARRLEASIACRMVVWQKI